VESFVATEEIEIEIEILCTDLPGVEWQGHTPLHLGIQRDKAVIEIASAGAERIRFHPMLRVRRNPDGSANFLGPFAQGPRTERFIYLNWLTLRGTEIASHVGRIKLHLNHLSFADVKKAADRDRPIRVTLCLTSPKNSPVMASVRPGAAKWELP
jgi:Family of unknown function (DUF5990)